MGAANEKPYDLVVGPDGSIPADQVARLGVAPGAHLRVVPTVQAPSLPEDFPDLSWEDFEQASKLAADDLTAA